MTKGGYQKSDIETRHPDLVSGMVQHHAAMFFPIVVQLPELVLHGQERSFSPCAPCAWEVASAISSHSAAGHLLALPGR